MRLAWVREGGGSGSGHSKDESQSANSDMQAYHISACTLNQLKFNAGGPPKWWQKIQSQLIEGLSLGVVQRSLSLLWNQCIKEPPLGLWSLVYTENH